jgi:hypothetical protein
LSFFYVLCGTWIMAGKKIHHHLCGFPPFPQFERHALSYHLTKKVWWCSTTIGVESLPFVFTSNLERGTKCYYYYYQLLMAIYIPNVLKVTSTQTWKITSMWKFSFYEHLSFPHWSMSEPKFYPQFQILHRCIVSSLCAEPIKKQIF